MCQHGAIFWTVHFLGAVVSILLTIGFATWFLEWAGGKACRLTTKGRK